VHALPEPLSQPDADLGRWRTWLAPLEIYVLALWVLLACVLFPTWIAGGADYRADIMRQIISPWVLPAMGLALALRQGRIDLSVWTVFTLSSVVSARLTQSGYQPLWVLAAAVGVGLSAGIIHAVAVAAVRIPSWVITPLTALAAMALAGWIAGGQVLVVDKAHLDRWLGADNELLITGSLIIATVILLMPLSMSRFVHNARRGRASSAAALIACAVLSAMGGLCWLLRDGRSPMPWHYFGDLRVPAAAVLAGAVVLSCPGRSALVAIMVPFAMAVVTAWRQLCWPTPTWRVDANLIALILLLLAAQWSFRYALHRPGWRVKVWPVLTGMGIVSIAVGGARSDGGHDVARAVLGAALWTLGTGAVVIHWARARLKRERPRDPGSDGA